MRLNKTGLWAFGIKDTKKNFLSDWAFLGTEDLSDESNTSDEA